MYYSGIEIRQLAVTLLLVGIGLYAYQHFREASLAQVQSSHSELQQHLDQMAAAQQELDAAKSEFLALASHQLRTPVSGIRWSSEMLLSGDLGELTEEQHDCIQGIEENNKRLADILSDMLLISNLDLNKLEVQAELVDVASLSRKTFANEVKKSKGKNIEIEEAYRADVPKLRVDEKIMATVLQHLYSNAIKYTPAGGKIMLSVKHDPERLYEGSKGSILIEVADTGYGIPHTQQKHVFAKMFRATNAKNKDTDGTGLGLYLVKALLDRVGGRIWFESEEGRGTTFWVLLPQEGMQRLDGSPRRNKDDA